MYVKFVEWGSGPAAEKVTVGTVRMNSGQMQIEGLNLGLRRNLDEELAFFNTKIKGDDEAFLRRLPRSFNGSYTWAVFVPEE